MKEGMNRYASKARFEQKGYFFKYCDRNSGRKACKTSGSHCIQQSREEEEEVIPNGEHSEENPDKRRDCAEGRRESNTQLKSCNAIFMDVQDISAGFVEPSRKTNDHQKLKNEELLEIKEEHESIREENVSEAYQEGRQRIQVTDQGRRKVKSSNLEKGEEMKKQTMKERKHEAKETKKFEMKEDKKENKSKKK